MAELVQGIALQAADPEGQGSNPEGAEVDNWEGGAERAVDGGGNCLGGGDFVGGEEDCWHMNALLMSKVSFHSKS